MEYTIQEMKAMQNIVSAILWNMSFKGSMRISKVYDIDDFDIATMEKQIAYWQETIDIMEKINKN